VYEGIVYPTAEAAFAAAKTLDVTLRYRIVAAPSPGAAKRMGRQLKLREDWEDIKVAVMRGILAAKFSDTALARRLKETQGQLSEDNTWHDQIWGNCVCPTHKDTPGRNLLGVLLMELRDTITLQNDLTQ
jgi:ribA/ribD-fused uncharacterized protein